MIEKRPLILITNDDSIAAPGLLRLVDCMPADADIVVVAPAEPHSGQASAITINSPLRVASRPDYNGARMFTVNGTPVDCVKLAAAAVLPRRPDFVFAGINHGSNSGCNVIYSGTMGAVMEGCALGASSCGFSLLHHSLQADFSMCMDHVRRIIAELMANPLPAGVCLNVNIPARVTPLGVKACRAARGHWSDEYRRYTDPTGNPFYMLAGHFNNDEPDATDTDEYWLSRNYISVVPVCTDLSDTAYIKTAAEIYNK